MRRVLAPLLALGLVAPPAMALERAESSDVAQNFLLFCGGCHGTAGLGVAHKVPVLNGAIGRFLLVDGGREFLLRVPGVANSQLSDTALAEVMNFCIRKFAAADLKQGFRPYTAAEVAAARRQPLLSVAHKRHELLSKAGVGDAAAAGY